MKKKDPGEKLSDLLRGGLPAGKRQKIISDLIRAGMDEEEINSIAGISDLIDAAPLEEPSAEMDRRFYETLAEEFKPETREKREVLRIRPTTPSRVWIRIAAGVALFILGWFMASLTSQKWGSGREIASLSDEMKSLRSTLVLSMLTQTSSIERIKAVNMASQIEYADDRIIESLFSVLDHDENDNVRLLALDALIKYSDNPAVRDGLVASIGKQSSPLVQLRLADVMIILNEKKAAPEFQKILTDAALNYSVRNRIREAVTILL